jgi:ketosteroid isomerase-like protein
MIAAEHAARFAEEWYAAWNGHDLDAVMSHYAADVEFVSPFIAELTGDASGTLRGTVELRAYFARALERFDDLRFEPLQVLVGVDSIVLAYVSVRELPATEVMTLGADGLVTHCRAHYASPT